MAAFDEKHNAEMNALRQEAVEQFQAMREEMGILSDTLDSMMDAMPDDFKAEFEKNAAEGGQIAKRLRVKGKALIRAPNNSLFLSAHRCNHCGITEGVKEKH